MHAVWSEITTYLTEPRCIHQWLYTCTHLEDKTYQTKRGEEKAIVTLLDVFARSSRRWAGPARSEDAFGELRGCWAGEEDGSLEMWRESGRGVWLWKYELSVRVFDERRGVQLRYACVSGRSKERGGLLRWWVSDQLSRWAAFLSL
jgi:hypothetical protein